MMTNVYWLPVDMHVISNGGFTIIYATWDRAGRLYTVKTMRAVFENDTRFYWSLRVADVSAPAKAEMLMINVDANTLAKHMVSANTLTAFARTHDGRLAADDYQAFVDALAAMNSVINDLGYWRTVSMLTNNENGNIHVFAPWVVDKDAWVTDTLCQF